MSVQALNRKEAIASGEDIAPVTREEYYLKGLAEGQGGGGVDYVIPEQTVTFQNGSATLQNINISTLESDDFVVAKLFVAESTSYTRGQYTSLETIIAFGDSAMGTINATTGKWSIEGVPDDTTITITAIRDF